MSGLSTDIKILPDVSTIDFTDGVEAGAYGHLLFVLLSIPQSDSCGKGFPDIIREARSWIMETERNIGNIPSGQIIPALTYYDMVHRIVYRKPAPAKFLNDIYMALFDQRIHGDTTISDTKLYGIVSERIENRAKPFFDRPLRWKSTTLEDWFDTSFTSGKFDNTVASEAIHKTSYMLNENLYAFCREKEEYDYKSRLVATCLPFYSTLESHDGKTLTALLHLLRHTRRTLSPNHVVLEANTLKALSQSTTIPPLSRTAFSLEEPAKAYNLFKP